MKQRYRLKLIVTSATGSLGFVLRLFPNALTFVGYPTQTQREQLIPAAGILGAFGIGLEVTESL